MDSNQNLDLRDFLSECIYSLKKNYAKFSSTQIAQKIGLSTSTFNRIENKEILKPTFSNAIKVVKAVCAEESVQLFIKNHYPEMYNNFKKTYTGNSDLNFLPGDTELYLKDPNTYEIMMLVLSDNATSKDFIKEEFGNRGIELVNNLIQKKILLEENQTVKVNIDRFNYEQDTVQKLLLNLVEKSYYLNAFGTQTNWASVQFQSVNKEKLRPILREIMIKATAETREAFNDPTNKGIDVMWVGLAFDSLFRKDLNSSNEEVLQ